MTDLARSFDIWFKDNKQKLIEDLLEYLSMDTSSPHEKEAFPFLHRVFKEVGAKTWEEPIKEEALHHAERCPPPMSKATHESANFMACIDGANKGQSEKTLVVSCHVDVVPAGPSWKEAFDPKVVLDENGDEIIVGRGACDTKGNLLMFLAALRFLKDTGLPSKYKIIYDGVIEEEIGGIGALSSSISNVVDTPYGVLVLEPTSLDCFRGHRGCLGISISIKGKSGHMGAGKKFGPIQAIGPLVDALGRLEEDLIETAKKDKAFSDYDRPVQVNVGRIEGGEWHGTAVETCRLLVNVGFPPQYNLQSIKDRIQHIMDEQTSETGLVHDVLYDGLHNEAYVDRLGTDLQKDFIKAMKKAGLDKQEPKAWHVSCDGRSYANKMNAPTIIFGCGDLVDAHSAHEKLDLHSFKTGALVLIHHLTT